MCESKFSPGILWWLFIFTPRPPSLVREGEKRGRWDGVIPQTKRAIF